MVFNEVIAGFHVLFNVIGLPGNLLVMVTIAFERFRIMRHVLLANLALSDFLCLILVNSFCILSTAQQNWLYGKTFCRLHPILVRYFYVNTALHLIAVSYERYNAIVKSPLTYSAAMTSSRVVGIVLIWLLPTVVFISRFRCLEVCSKPQTVPVRASDFFGKHHHCDYSANPRGCSFHHSRPSE